MAAVIHSGQLSVRCALNLGGTPREPSKFELGKGKIQHVMAHIPRSSPRFLFVFPWRNADFQLPLPVLPPESL
ncbi:hypothetical protein CVT25_009049 [Psilocybe cyanescens]|uniref:Uncharacterized protein n=1 Tax=Psilocybe cyanescens TaxID=93625 RepID=A0A409X2X2_PSICY|nr:hypothetical protein CVT25_009049 [Psilocybe cyanescens]